MTGINVPPLTDILERLGPAFVFVGDPLVAGGMEYLGTLEGDRTFDIDWAEEKLTLPESTGGVPHQVGMAVDGARVSTGIILNGEGAAVWEKINPMGRTGGGSTQFESPVETSVLLIPIREVGGGLTNPASVWNRAAGFGIPASATPADAAPKHAVWLWRAYAKHGSVPYPFGDGGKSRVEVTFEGMLDVTKPEGYMVYDIGDPTVHGIPVLL